MNAYFAAVAAMTELLNTLLQSKKFNDAKEVVDILERLNSISGDTLEVDGLVPAEVTALGDGLGSKKIDAIKLVRNRTGIGLKEAKDRVEAYARRHGIAW